MLFKPVASVRQKGKMTLGHQRGSVARTLFSKMFPWVLLQAFDSFPTASFGRLLDLSLDHPCQGLRGKGSWFRTSAHNVCYASGRNVRRGLAQDMGVAIVYPCSVAQVLAELFSENLDERGQTDRIVKQAWLSAC